MAKKLRLAAAGLTDVGRRRERNQDNVSHHVPSDERVLENKGALFVVCDGMGGHAAGEVASEMAVQSLLDAYYAGADDDIITAVANAIKQANQSVFRYAGEHPEMKGMGTTCVALVVHGGRAYFVNIGDSRGYLVRNGVMRQITLDHSWVAEQVRAGLLTEDQARTHAHRNVITRSVGTQPHVSADLFIETLRDGDRVLLCSDGLHGYVDEEFIEREMTSHDEPEAGAQHLIDMANENGGPDNITAMVVHLLEVPEVTGEVKLPASVEGEEQVITRPLPAIVGATALPAAEKDGSGGKHAARRKRAGGARVAAAALRVLAVAAILCLAFGGWDFAIGPYGQARAAASRLHSDVSALKQAAQHATTGQDPAQSLASLATARDRVVADLNNKNLDGQTAASARMSLATDLAPAVREAAQSYNRTALVTPINVTTAQVYDLACVVPGQTAPVALTHITQLAALAANVAAASGVETLYAVNDGHLFQIQAPVDATGTASFGSATCGAAAVPGMVSVESVVAVGSIVYLLGQQSNGQSLVVSLQTSGVDKDGTANVKAQPGPALALPTGSVAQRIAVDGSNLDVSYQASGGSAAGVQVYDISNAKTPVKTLPLSQPTVNLVATSHAVYATLQDGTLAQLDPSRGVIALRYQAPKPISPDVINDYVGDQPVPSVNTAAQSLASNLTLLVDPATASHLLVGDSGNNRILRLSDSPGGGDLSLLTQYVYTPPIAGIGSCAMTSNGTNFTVYGLNGDQLVAFSAPEGGSGA